MATIHAEDGEPFDSAAWERINDQALVELAYVARDLAAAVGFGNAGERTRVTAQAYEDLADVATTLRLIRQGNDRLRETRQRAEANVA